MRQKLYVKEETAINKRPPRLRATLNKGFYKYKKSDFVMPRDLKKERAQAKEDEYRSRLTNFMSEMDDIIKDQAS